MGSCAILDFPAADGSRGPLVFASPRSILAATSVDEVRGTVRAAELEARAGAWVVGFVSYGAAPAFDSALAVRGGSAFPLACFCVFDAPSDRQTESTITAQAAFESWHASVERERFDQDIAAIRKAIFDGDAYQVNYTLRLHGRYAGTPLELFQRLQRVQPNSYAAYLDFGQWRILSVSPELFFRRDGRILTARPMKGTARRGRYLAEDRDAESSLQASVKDRAENLMIVDLLRNDLSRVAMPDTVRVPALFAVERHPTLLQMTSTITAQCRPGVSLEDIFAALFPCGSITGAPKVKAMEIIAARETEPRDLYCGAIGLLHPGGDAVFNVAIRTVTLNTANRTATCGVGAGIVWDSTAPNEYQEVMLKARFLNEDVADFCLLETLRLDHGCYVRLDYHLARLARSARSFARPFDAALCRRKLAALAGQTEWEAARVRIALQASGAVEVDVSPYREAIEQPARFALADHPVSRDDIWLFHKTTRRDVFERACAAHPEAFDVLLWNEQQELTEFTRGNLVLEIDGGKLTPALDCGLLDGCLRRELLDQGQIAEARLTVDDLARAGRIWFINSLRGWIRIED